MKRKLRWFTKDISNGRLYAGRGTFLSADGAVVACIFGGRSWPRWGVCVDERPIRWVESKAMARSLAESYFR